MTSEEILKYTFDIIVDFLENNSIEFFGYVFTLLDVVVGLCFVCILGFVFYKIFD